MEREGSKSKFQVRDAMKVITTSPGMRRQQQGVAFQVTAIVQRQYQKVCKEMCARVELKSQRRQERRIAG
jgi:hypothetical protein